jgi:hypothetical protein
VKILPIILHYQKEFCNIAELIEKQNELMTKSEQGKYDFAEFGYSSISLLLSSGNRRDAREFIDMQPVSYIIAEYRRELKISENKRHFEAILAAKYKH